MSLDMAAFDWKAPDYSPVFTHRMAMLERIKKMRRENPQQYAALWEYYKNNIAVFINDWGVTFDPRSASDDTIPPFQPFLLFPKQHELVEWILDRWKGKESGLLEKSRELGASWIAIAVACSICTFYRGMVIGFGSRVEDDVDKIGDPDCLFYKARMFMSYLPKIFRGGWEESKHAPHLRILFPGTGSVIKGQSGRQIGRGGRAGIYFVDESAHLEHPDDVEMSLSQTTRVRIDMSSVNGSANPFAQKRHNGSVPVFTFHWRDDPRKDEEWYQKESARLGPVVTAQELDIDYSASIEGIIIPSAWVQASVDAHVKLGFHPSGDRGAALDIADTGDTCGFVGMHGNVVESIEEWSGAGSNLFQSTAKAMALCASLKYKTLWYDSDGMGVNVKGDAEEINRNRSEQLLVMPYRGSGAVVNPTDEDQAGWRNEDYFHNRKAQAWWATRTRFMKTYQAVVEDNKSHKHSDLISIPSHLPLRNKLCMELSQPQAKWRDAGKMLVDKMPKGAKSPNLADAFVIKINNMGGQAEWATMDLVMATRQRLHSVSMRR